MGDNMENNKAKSYIGQINARQIDIKRKMAYIEHERQEFEKRVAASRAGAEQLSQEVNVLRATRFNVSLESVFRGLAKVWGVDRGDMVIEMRTNQDIARIYEYDASDFLDDVLRNPSRRTRVVLYVTAWYGEEDSAKKVEFSKRVDLDSVQADGKELWEHVFVDTSKTKEGYHHFALKFDSYENVLLNYTFGELLSEPDEQSILVYPKNEYSSAVLNAIDEGAVELTEEDEAE